MIKIPFFLLPFIARNNASEYDLITHFLISGCWAAEPEDHYDHTHTTLVNKLVKVKCSLMDCLSSHPTHLNQYQHLSFQEVYYV